MDEFLSSSKYADITPEVRNLAEKLSKGTKNKREAAIKIFYFIRDLKFGASPIYKASEVLKHLNQPLICASKAALQVACCRALGIPSRFHTWKVSVSDDVISKINELLFAKSKRKFKKGGILFHVSTEVFLDRWIIADATIDRSLNLIFKIKDWDGETDVLLDGFEYLEDLGSSIDIPEIVIKFSKGSYLPFYLRPFAPFIMNMFNRRLNLIFKRIREKSQETN